MPRECPRPITLFLRGLRNSGTRQFQKLPEPGHPAVGIAPCGVFRSASPALRNSSNDDTCPPDQVIGIDLDHDRLESLRVRVFDRALILAMV